MSAKKASWSFAEGIDCTNSIAWPLAGREVFCRARYTLRRSVLRLTALRASFLETTAAQRKGGGESRSFSESAFPRPRERPRASTSRTSAAVRRWRLASIQARGLRAQTGASFAAAAHNGLAAPGAFGALKKTMCACAFALFWLVCLRHLSNIPYPHFLHNLYTKRRVLTRGCTERILSLLETYDNHERNLGKRVGGA